MLVLGRKKNEAVVLKCGDMEILITVLDVDRGKVRIGFNAPDNVTITRTELLENGDAEVSQTR